MEESEIGSDSSQSAQEEESDDGVLTSSLSSSDHSSSEADDEGSDSERNDDSAISALGQAGVVSKTRSGRPPRGNSEILEVRSVHYLWFCIIIPNFYSCSLCNAALLGSSAPQVSKQRSFRSVCWLGMGEDAEEVHVRSGVGCARLLCASI